MFHQPVQSVATYRLWLSRHSGASTDSRLLPLISRALPGLPPSTGATLSSVPSHGMCGWFQQIHASHCPSGDGVGKAKKSKPVTSTRMAASAAAADPSSGTATMALVTLPPAWRSRTHHTSAPSGESAKSAYRSAPGAAGLRSQGHGLSRPVGDGRAGQVEPLIGHI